MQKVTNNVEKFLKYQDSYTIDRVEDKIRI